MRIAHLFAGEHLAAFRDLHGLNRLQGMPGTDEQQSNSVKVKPSKQTQQSPCKRRWWRRSPTLVLFSFSKPGVAVSGGNAIDTLTCVPCSCMQDQWQISQNLSPCCTTRLCAVDQGPSCLACAVPTSFLKHSASPRTAYLLGAYALYPAKPVGEAGGTVMHRCYVTHPTNLLEPFDAMMGLQDMQLTQQS